MTVGKIYGGLLIFENWKTTKFGNVPFPKVTIKVSPVCSIVSLNESRRCGLLILVRKRPSAQVVACTPTLSHQLGGIHDLFQRPFDPNSVPLSSMLKNRNKKPIIKQTFDPAPPMLTHGDFDGPRADYGERPKSLGQYGSVS